MLDALWDTQYIHYVTSIQHEARVNAGERSASSYWRCVFSGLRECQTALVHPACHAGPKAVQATDALHPFSLRQRVPVRGWWRQQQ